MEEPEIKPTAGLLSAPQLLSTIFTSRCSGEPIPCGICFNERANAVNEPAEPYPALKRCPFCGSVGILEEVESEDGYRFDVYCINVQYCGGTTSRCRSAAKAIEFWNRRFTDVK
jgi:hypothetical protein